MDVHLHIIQLKSFTIQRCTRQNFANLILSLREYVSMGIFAHLRIMTLKFQLICWIDLTVISIFIYFTSRQSGVHTRKRIMTGWLAFMRTIGKITDASPTCTLTKTNNAPNGTLKTRLLTTKKLVLKG